MQKNNWGLRQEVTIAKHMTLSAVNKDIQIDIWQHLCGALFLQFVVDEKCGIQEDRVIYIF